MAIHVPLNRAKDFTHFHSYLIRVNSLRDRYKREKGRRRTVCKEKGETSFLLSSFPSPFSLLSPPLSVPAVQARN